MVEAIAYLMHYRRLGSLSNKLGGKTLHIFLRDSALFSCKIHFKVGGIYLYKTNPFYGRVYYSIGEIKNNKSLLISVVSKVL
jgi:hypothetical protein